MRFSLIAILLLIVGRASAQNDTIFPNVDGTWSMTTTTWDWDGQNMNFMDYNYTLEYHAQPSVETDGLSWGSVTKDQGTQIGLIAVDDDKVLYRATSPFGYGYGVYDDTTTQVLYNFGLQVGDTAYWPAFNAPHTVQYVDTVWLDGRVRKRLTLNNGEEWVSGVGSLLGLLEPFQDYFEVAYSMSAFCGNYMDSDSVAYQACMPFTVGVAQVEKVSPVIHPNPSSGTFAVEHALPNSLYRLTDMRGIEVLSGRTTGESTTIRIPNAVPGLYVLNVDGTRTKVIVQ